MGNSSIRWLIIFGILSIIGIISVQCFWVYRTLDLKENEFHQSVTVALRKVANKLSEYNQTNISYRGLIKREANNQYVVNLNGSIDAIVLEHYLLEELFVQGIDLPFEYGIYDCQTDELVYANCCDYTDQQIKPELRTDLNVDDEYVYYFTIRFPSMTSHILSDMPLSVFLSFVTLMACLIFVLAMYTILKQKRYSELQSDFINNITHEFKTPLSSIKLAAEAFLRHDFIKGDTRLFNYAQIIRNQNEHLNHQVQKVLNLARQEKTRFTLSKEELDLNAFISEMSDELTFFVQKNHGQLKIDLPHEPVSILGDPVHIKNVIFNIVENAIKYSRESVEIAISLTPGDKNARLSISDSGPGIDEEHHSKIFDKFYRVSTGNVHNVKGFGLGLYYVKQISEAHNWIIQLISVPSKGTQVKFLIPQ